MAVTELVKEILKKDLCIQKDIKRGLINIRALSRYIIKKYELDVTLDSVINILRRLESEIKSMKYEDEKIINIIKSSTISTKNNKICYTIKNSDYEVISRIIKFKEEVDDKDIFIILGPSLIKIIFPAYYEKEMKDIFKKVIVIKSDVLSEISLEISPKAVNKKGIMAKIANELAIHNINIVELIITPPTLIIYVKQDDILKAHEVLLKIED